MAIRNIFLLKTLTLDGFAKSQTLAQTVLSSCVFNITDYISLSVRVLFFCVSKMAKIFPYVSLSDGLMYQIEFLCYADKMTGWPTSVNEVRVSFIEARFSVNYARIPENWDPEGGINWGAIYRGPLKSRASKSGRALGSILETLTIFYCCRPWAWLPRNSELKWLGAPGVPG